MFDKKSDYAHNKREKNAIVCISVTGKPVLLTRADFASEGEFQKWKAWSDGDYRDCEQQGRSFYDNSVPLDERLDVIGAVASCEAEFFGKLDEAEQERLCAEMMEQIKSGLTDKQFSRLWMHNVSNMSVRVIAEMEGVTQQAVSLSISTAKRKMKKFFKKFFKNTL